METEEDDDIYASGDGDRITNANKASATSTFPLQGIDGQKPPDLEEGEEEDEDEEEESDSVRSRGSIPWSLRQFADAFFKDIDIITERQDEPKSEPAQCDYLPLLPLP